MFQPIELFVAPLEITFIHLLNTLSYTQVNEWGVIKHTGFADLHTAIEMEILQDGDFDKYTDKYRLTFSIYTFLLLKYAATKC